MLPLHPGRGLRPVMVVLLDRLVELLDLERLLFLAGDSAGRPLEYSLWPFSLLDSVLLGAVMWSLVLPIALLYRLASSSSFILSLLDFSTPFFVVLIMHPPDTWALNMHREKKIANGNFFGFRAKKYI